MLSFESYQRNEKDEIFYPGLGWITRERYNQSDVQAAEKLKGFLSNPENVMNCGECSENRDFSDWPGTTLPCGQQHCWVSLHCK